MQSISSHSPKLNKSNLDAFCDLMLTMRNDAHGGHRGNHALHAISSGVWLNDEQNMIYVMKRPNGVPHAIRNVFQPIDQILDFNEKFKEECSPEERIFRQRQASPTIHSEVFAAGPVTMVNQICCPRCAAFIALCGCKQVIYDINADQGDYYKIRKNDSGYTADIFKRGGVATRTLDPEARKFIETQWTNTNPPPPDFDAGQFMRLETCAYATDSFEGMKEQLFEEAIDFLHEGEILNPFSHYGAYAYGRDGQGRGFIAIARPALPPGLSLDTYLQDYQQNEQTDPNVKYSMVIPPLTAMKALLRRQGVLPQDIHFGTTAPPTARDLVNVLDQPIHDFVINAPTPECLRELTSPDAGTQTKRDTHKNGKTMTYYKFPLALDMINKERGFIKFTQRPTEDIEPAPSRNNSFQNLCL